MFILYMAKPKAFTKAELYEYAQWIVLDEETNVYTNSILYIESGGVNITALRPDPSRYIKVEPRNQALMRLILMSASDGGLNGT